MLIFHSAGRFELPAMWEQLCHQPEHTFMPDDTAAEFQLLARESDIPLPDSLQRLLASGKTRYSADWPLSWRERCLHEPPALISLYDFEWITASGSRQHIEQWLNPEDQQGRRFLPFAESGAGDVYCLTPIDDGAPGVALILHDAEYSRIAYRSFDDFICASFLETFADMSHLVDDFSEQEALLILRRDVSQLAGVLGETAVKYLQAFVGLPAGLHESSRPGDPARVFALISRAQLEAERGHFPSPEIAPFKITARWELRPAVASTTGLPSEKKPADWRDLALDPRQKLAAIQFYRQQHGGSLGEAKAAIERYLADTR
ncbi:SMI1/KNR4 family protein [Azovibrio restrictus]|uniref:SMI1/KNR4 family protein n=1 Tax=Azovibrio restrictus TaxID=146938 RepID=UPI000684F0BD|nr:SMI1/KNR4 family protein [Azovibrio restrictus]